MNNCLICNKVIEEDFTSLICEEKNVCSDCYKCFKIRNDKFIIDGVEGEVLYYYDEFFKSVLYKYKGCGDYALKDVFLEYKKNELRKRYRKYSIVLAPSNKEVEIRRGFNHLEGVFESLKLPILKCFKKTKLWKQSDKKLNERRGIHKIIKIDKSCLNGVKRVLIVDDILTSGSTIRSLICQLPPCIDKKVLVLSSNCRILGNEII